MVGFSNVLLLLVSLAGLTNGLLKPAGEKRASGIGEALGTLGRGLLSGLFGGAARYPAGGDMDPGLANVLSQFGREFGDKSATGSAGTIAGVGSAPTSAGSNTPQREPDSSEEKTKVRPNKQGDIDAGESTTRNPLKPAEAGSGEVPAQRPAKPTVSGPSEGTAENLPKPAPGTTGLAGGVGGDVAKSLGAAAGAALASTILRAITDAIARSKEKKRGKMPGRDRNKDRREKRSLVDELGLIESKGALKGLNLESDLPNGVYCGRHEMPNPGGVRDRFCHPKASWATLIRMRPECVCQPGFLRNSWGECISPAECNQCRSKHGFNMDYHLCGSPCPIVCNQPIDEYCPNTCIRKCACRPGFIRNSLMKTRGEKDKITVKGVQKTLSRSKRDYK